jgi:hypothetical protein
VQNEQHAGHTKQQMQQAVIIKKQETYNTQTKQVDDVLAQENLKNLRHFKKTFKQIIYIQNVSELTEENYNVA